MRNRLRYNRCDHRVELDTEPHQIPQFVTHRVEDFFLAWNPVTYPLWLFAVSLYTQGLQDGFAVGEEFTKRRAKRK